jgi:16S rRNA (uracil1498-N3)-methyltransferase
MNRWNHLAQEARKQCGRHLPMLVAAPMPLTSWLNSELTFPRFLLDAQGSPFPLEILEATLLVGPEGGLTLEEKELAKSQGFECVSLSPLTLRSETAAIAALALLSRLKS